MLVCPSAEICFGACERYQISSCQTKQVEAQVAVCRVKRFDTSVLICHSCLSQVLDEKMYFQDVSPSCLCRGGPGMRPQRWNLSPDELRFQNTAQSCQETGGFCKLQWLLVKFYPFLFLNVSLWFYCALQVLHRWLIVTWECVLKYVGSLVKDSSSLVLSFGCNASECSVLFLVLVPIVLSHISGRYLFLHGV